MRRLSRPAPLAVCAVVAALLTACATPASSADGGGAPLPTIGLGSDLSGGPVFVAGSDSVSRTDVDSVVMIGDSITVASRGQLEQVFDELGFDTVAIEAQQSKRTASGSKDNPSGSDIAAARVSIDDSGEGLDHSGELWVVALGTNDISQYSDPAERAGAIDEMLRAVPSDSPLVWVDTFYRDRPEDSAEINATIAARLDDRGNATLARWSAVAADEGNLRDDGVHPREQGSTVFAGVVGAAIVDFVDLD